METKLTPVSHPTLPDHHRVPVIMQDGRYQIYLIENYVRIYDEDELPDLVKTRIAMIKAGTTSPIPQHWAVELISQIYECPRESNLYEIGWQPCEGLYVVVIPTKYLTYMLSQAYAQQLAYRHIEGYGFIANDRPVYRTLEDYLDWLHQKEKLRSK
jgi:hypothetical protein